MPWIVALCALARVATAAPGEPVAGAVVAPPTPVLEAARRVLAARLAQDGIRQTPLLIEAGAVTWPDGSLGCGAPRAASTAVLVPGYRLVFAADGRRYEIHASAAGAAVACEPRRPRAVLPSGPKPVAPQ